MSALADIWPAGSTNLHRLVPARHTPARFTATGCDVLHVTPTSTTIAATVSPDLDDPDEIARIVADALNARLR
jgi:hypothetical protein